MNPAIDEAVSIDGFRLGEQNRCTLENLDPGGKGINASRVIHRLGRPTIALGFIGGVTGQLLRARLDEERVLHAFDHVSEATRINVMIYEARDGRRTRLYLQGPHVEPEKMASLRVRLAQVHPGTVVVFGGSVPPGIPSTIYYDLVTEMNARNVRTIVDTSGEALIKALAARPLLIKPDLEEVQEILQRELSDDDSVIAAAQELQRRGPRNVVISLGDRGAIAVGPDAMWRANAPSVVARSTVGAGDSMVAGLAIALNEDLGLQEGLRLGSAAGAATVMVSGTQLCDAQVVAQLLDQITIVPLGAEKKGAA